MHQQSLFNEESDLKAPFTRFTQEEDNRIIHLINVYSYDYEQVGAVLQRSYSSIAGRVRRLRREGRVIQPGVGTLHFERATEEVETPFITRAIPFIMGGALLASVIGFLVVA